MDAQYETIPGQPLTGELIKDLENAEHVSLVFDEDCPEAAEVIKKEREIVKYGIAKGKFAVPDDIDEYNDEIAEMFGVNE